LYFLFFFVIYTNILVEVQAKSVLGSNAYDWQLEVNVNYIKLFYGNIVEDDINDMNV
jgi:hypothetical protein